MMMTRKTFCALLSLLATMLFVACAANPHKPSQAPALSSSDRAQTVDVIPAEGTRKIPVTVVRP